MKRFFKLLPVAVFLFMIMAVMSAGILQKDKTYSSAENRTLQAFPKLNVKRVLNGKFQKKYETYLSDQFPERDLVKRNQMVCILARADIFWRSIQIKILMVKLQIKILMYLESL